MSDSTLTHRTATQGSRSRRSHSSVATGSESLPSDAYKHVTVGSRSSKGLTTFTESNDDPATSSTPTNLTPKQRQQLERILRVDQAGELGANLIYAGQLSVFKRSRSADPSLAALIQHMWDQEKKHIETFDKVIVQHKVRPTVLWELWKVAGWTLGAGTALMGREAAMACTEAVETVIGEHYAE